MSEETFNQFHDIVQNYFKDWETTIRRTLDKKPHKHPQFFIYYNFKQIIDIEAISFNSESFQNFSYIRRFFLYINASLWQKNKNKCSKDIFQNLSVFFRQSGKEIMQNQYAVILRNNYISKSMNNSNLQWKKKLWKIKLLGLAPPPVHKLILNKKPTMYDITIY